MYSWGAILLGGITYLDAGWRFPIWLTGPWAFALGTPFIIGGVVALLSTYKLPVREALLFASTQKGELTAPSLSIALNITLETAEIILANLVQKGYARISDDDLEEGAVVYKISGIDQLTS
ncbi:hypothetical protein CSB45_06300 [candidate division KSB3 bacterium]|uniref:Uncharacterized protein n=1 Tax=candidate division KSB3 bacterium TaxID=2044937 RepID=A0A2G6E7T5_9BACT|nr:MAG: hypothetical protein CSB45_06300 [candidate division KSB3 bacterium]PIE30254.1 MAG: hypothetical protein CSA57_05015 [candidate division KSB3 bacterium]